MPKVSDVTLFFQSEQKTLSIRTRTTMAGLHDVIVDSYSRITAYLAQLNVWMSDAPFVAYHGMNEAELDVEIGFQVAQDLPGQGDLQPSVIAPGRAVVSMYRGAYSELEPLYEEMAAYIVENRLEAENMVYEYYYNGSNFPESEYLTKIVMRVK
ncbi:MAG: GyrI-like domain-containing protein [Peptococcaceae bacterium]|jgi:effector-binding domain-containing protein|nr:GyrI-like domain-containing protein [Peptococcaceae bacterium]